MMLTRPTSSSPNAAAFRFSLHTPDDFLDQVKMTDEEVRAEYQKRIRDYSTPETRVVVEFQSDNRNTVQAFVDLTQQGISVEEALAKTPGLTRKETTVKPADLADQQYRDFIFAMEAGKVHNAPIRQKEDEPWRAIMVQTITPGVATPYEQIADKVRRDVSWNEAAGLFEKSSEPVPRCSGRTATRRYRQAVWHPGDLMAPARCTGAHKSGDQSQIMTKNQDALRQLFTLAAWRHERTSRRATTCARCSDLMKSSPRTTRSPSPDAEGSREARPT